MKNSFDFPKSLHQLHLFEQDGCLYAADLDKARLCEISLVIADILKIAETQTTEAITQSLKNAYSDEDIEEAFETLTEYVQQGLLFTCGEKPDVLFRKREDCLHLLLILQGLSPDAVSDIANTSACTHIALAYTVQALKTDAVIYFAGTQNRKLSKNLYEVDLSLRDIVHAPERIAVEYDGILTIHFDRKTDTLLPLFRCAELPPILVQVHCARGHGGTNVRSVLLHYAALRDYDAFTAPSDSVGEFYSRFVWDKNVFRKTYGTSKRIHQCRCLPLQQYNCSWISKERCFFSRLRCFSEIRESLCFKNKYPLDRYWISRTSPGSRTTFSVAALSENTRANQQIDTQIIKTQKGT